MTKNSLAPPGLVPFLGSQPRVPSRQSRDSTRGHHLPRLTALVMQFSFTCALSSNTLETDISCLASTTDFAKGKR